MRNFDFLKNEPAFKTLYGYCYLAEEFQCADPDKSALNARRALEYLVKAIYLLNKYETGENPSLFELVDDRQFKDFLGADSFDLLRRLHYIRKAGNNAAHVGNVSRKESFFSLLNLHAFTGAVLNKLGVISEVPDFDKTLIPQHPQPVIVPEPKEVKPDASVVENLPKVEKLTESVKISGDLTEKETRKLFIDQLLKEAGWEVLDKKNLIAPSKACIEIALEGMPNAHAVGYADYVLFGANGVPLAVVEAKRTSVDIAEGRHQADLYAKCLEAKCGVKPIIYLSNGFRTTIIDGLYPEREVYGFHREEELELLIQRRGRSDISDLQINDDITNREYQKRAIKAVCEHFNSNHRKALLVMATGTGKTRTAVLLVDVLIRNNWVRNVLFLADRKALVSQALRKGFAKFLPQMTFCELSDNGNPDKDLNARVVLSTYQTMINYIDADDKQFGVGRFDLIIIDEAHRSVFGKYGSIFEYFDALLIGLTATPREEVGKSTYQLFELEEGIPNFAYELQESVADGYLVPFKAYKRGTKILESGIKYNELPQSEKEQLESVWEYEEGEARDIESSEIFKYIFNNDTVDVVLQDLMTNGLKVQDGQRIGKTIIFAANHQHAELIVKRFGVLYPQYGADFCTLIDNYVNYSRDLIDRFEVRDGLPQIAVSVDMLDTGIDVPDILNLVFFKVVKSKIKFNQMIGRGTRLSEGIFGEGKNKEYFKIFDWCGNFDYFSMNANGEESADPQSLSERVFGLKTDIAFELQTAAHQAIPFDKSLHDALKAELRESVAGLNDKRIDVRMNREAVEKYRKEESWQYVSAVDVVTIKGRIGHLLLGNLGEESALRFDALMLLIELSLLDNTVNSNRAKKKVIRIAQELTERASIPQVKEKMNIINEVLTENFWDNLTLSNLEKVRTALREIVQFVEHDGGKTFTTDIDDVFMDGGEIETSISPVTYRQRVIDYLAENEDLPVLNKIKTLQQLDKSDIQELEDILWNKLGCKDEYERMTSQMQCGDHVGIFIRSIIGVDRPTAVQMFSDLISRTDLNARQEEYLKSIIAYVCENGDIQRNNLTNTAPFADYNWLDTGENYTACIGQYVDKIHEVIVA